MTRHESSPDSARLRGVLPAHRDELAKVFAKYGAYDIKLFGSVARGEAGPRSDIDLMVSIDRTGLRAGSCRCSASPTS